MKANVFEALVHVQTLVVTLKEQSQPLSSVREAPLQKMPGLFGHCPNSDCTPPPSLKRALWGTLFPDRLEQMPFELQFSLYIMD